MEGVYVVIKLNYNRVKWDSIIGIYLSNELAEQEMFNYVRKLGLNPEDMTINENDGMRHSECYTCDFNGISFMIEEFAFNTKY